MSLSPGELMTTVFIKLKLIGRDRYALFGPLGNQIGPDYYGAKDKAKEWGQAFCSTWYNWRVDSKEIDDEETSGVPE
jgi:hypothetical protein